MRLPAGVRPIPELVLRLHVRRPMVLRLLWKIVYLHYLYRSLPLRCTTRTWFSNNVKFVLIWMHWNKQPKKKKKQQTILYLLISFMKLPLCLLKLGINWCFIRILWFLHNKRDQKVYSKWYNSVTFKVSDVIFPSYILWTVWKLSLDGRELSVWFLFRREFWGSPWARISSRRFAWLVDDALRLQLSARNWIRLCLPNRVLRLARRCSLNWNGWLPRRLLPPRWPTVLRNWSFVFPDIIEVSGGP